MWRSCLRLALTLAAVVIATAAAAQQGEQQVAHLGTCPLASGQVIQDCRIGYRTFGTLNAQKTNVVIMPTWLNGRSDDLVPLFGSTPGPQRLVDTSRFYGIAFDAFGDGISSSPSNSPRQSGTDFPVFNMEDMVRAQYRVLTGTLGLHHIHAAIGLSMGGHQVFAWAALYPGFLDRAIPIVGSPRATAFDLLSKQIVINAIDSDPEYHQGHYTTEPQLSLANEIGTLLVSAPGFRNAQVARNQFPRWLASIDKPQRQDANDRVWQLKAILQHDVLHGRSVAEVTQGSAIQYLVIVAAEDRMVTPQPALDWARAVGAETYISPGSCAHLILQCDAPAVSERVGAFLAR